jgi:hypothetical protein
LSIQSPDVNADTVKAEAATNTISLTAKKRQLDFENQFYDQYWQNNRKIVGVDPKTKQIQYGSPYPIPSIPSTNANENPYMKNWTEGTDYDFEADRQGAVNKFEIPDLDMDEEEEEEEPEEEPEE